MIAGGSPEAITRTARRRDAWFDSGLACSLVGTTVERVDDPTAPLGPLLERADGQIVGIEVKASSTITTRDTKGLRFLERRLGDRFHAGYVISTLPEPTPLGAKITAVPCNWLWEAGTANTAT